MEGGEGRKDRKLTLEDLSFRRLLEELALTEGIVLARTSTLLYRNHVQRVHRRRGGGGKTGKKKGGKEGESTLSSKLFPAWEDRLVVVRSRVSG